MEKLLAVANALNNLYKEEYEGKDMDELRMHKLMYFAQRESLIETGQALFRGQFEGWKYGPVLPVVRTELRKEKKFEDVEAVSDESRELIKKVYDRYKDLSSHRINRISHNEFSWQHSRNGLDSEDAGREKITLDAIKIDAVKEKIRRALEAQ